MNIFPKTQTETDLSMIETCGDSSILALAATASALNHAYDATWNLPEERLSNVLQSLENAGELEALLSIHEQSANTINGILDAVEFQGIRAKVGKARDFTIENGIVSLSPLPSLSEIPFNE